MTINKRRKTALGPGRPSLDLILLDCFSVKTCKLFHNYFVKNLRNLDTLLEYVFKPFNNKVA